jgi:hypothetical protein
LQLIRQAESSLFIGEIAIHPLELAALGKEILIIVSCFLLDSEELLRRILKINFKGIDDEIKGEQLRD